MGAVEGAVGRKDLDVIGEAEAEGQMLMHLRPLMEGEPHAPRGRLARHLFRGPEAAQRGGIDAREVDSHLKCNS